MLLFPLWSSDSLFFFLSTGSVRGEIVNALEKPDARSALLFNVVFLLLEAGTEHFTRKLLPFYGACYFFVVFFFFFSASTTFSQFSLCTWISAIAAPSSTNEWQRLGFFIAGRTLFASTRQKFAVYASVFPSRSVVLLRVLCDAERDIGVLW